MRQAMLYRVFIFVSLILTTDAFATIRWHVREVSVDAKPGQKEVIAVFPFTVDGPESVTIQDVITGCECTVAELPKRTFASGESGEIRTVFTLGDRMGPQERRITVTTDDRTNGINTLVLRVAIPELLAFSHRMLRWKINEQEGEKSVLIEAKNDSPVATMSVQSIMPENAATARIEVLDQGRQYRVAITPTRRDGPVTAAVTIRTRFEDGLERTSTVHALVR